MLLILKPCSCEDTEMLIVFSLSLGLSEEGLQF
jgi:hypothetical protein